MIEKPPFKALFPPQFVDTPKNISTPAASVNRFELPETVNPNGKEEVYITFKDNKTVPEFIMLV